MKALPNESDALDGLRKANIPPGDYVFPYAGSMEAMKSPEYVEKFARGPVGYVTFRPAGSMSMTGSLIQWFLYSILVSFFSAYIAGVALAPGAEYLRVFQLVGASAFMGYSLALMQGAIWYKRNWGATFRSMIDGLVYALLTAGTLGWLWPN
jgi:hypothetical protein